MLFHKQNFSKSTTAFSIISPSINIINIVDLGNNVSLRVLRIEKDVWKRIALEQIVEVALFTAINVTVSKPTTV